MKLLKPVAMTDAILLSSNVTENDAAEWDVSATYSASDQVIVLSTHKIYESQVGSNLGNDPTTDDGTNWLEVSYTNRWKAFDSRLADQVSRSGTITYSFTAPSFVSGIAFFNLSAAELRVQVYDLESPANEIYDTTVDLVDSSDIVSWWTFFTTTIDRYRTEVVLADLAAFAGYQIDVTIGDGVGTQKVGEIAFGRVVELGETLEGSTIGLTSFSTKTQDDFGNWNITSRAKSDPVGFTFAMQAADAARVKRELNGTRDTPAVFFAHEDLVEDYAAMTYGLFQTYEIPLQNRGVSIVNLEIEGLT